MQVFFLLIFLFIPLLADSKPIDNDFEPITLELKQHVTPKEFYIQKQQEKLATFGLKYNERYVPFDKLDNENPMFFDPMFPNDYLATQIQFGVPPQNLSILFSTGNHYAILVGDKCVNKNPRQRGFIPKDSYTAKKTGKTLSVVYDGHYYFNADLYKDQMQIGKLKITDQDLAVANLISERDVPFPTSGLLGLAHFYPKWSKIDNSTKSPVDNLLSGMVEKVVTIYLDKYLPPKGSNQSSGLVTIGGYDLDNCHSKSASEFFITYNFYDYPVYYAVIKSFSYGTTAITTANGQSVYFESSYSTILMGLNSLQQLYAILRPDFDFETGLYVVDCKDIGTFYALNFVFPTGTIVINSPYYVVDLNLDNNRCALALEFPTNDVSLVTYAVFGTPFFRAYCATFDLQNNGVYIIPHAN